MNPQKAHPTNGSINPKIIFIISLGLLISIGLLGTIKISHFTKNRSVTQRNDCVAHQKQIASAVEGWALENKKLAGSVVTPADITPYLKGQVWPICPAGGTIVITTIDTAPTCTIASHTGLNAIDDTAFSRQKHPWLDAIIHPGRKKDDRNACIANLKQIQSMIEQWALENKKMPGAPVKLTDLTPYIYRPRYEKPVLPACPAGGIYAVTIIDAPPTCTIAGHTL